MLDPSIELARGAFIIGLVITAVFYERLRVLTGGAITASYIAFLLLNGNYADVVAWLFLTAIGIFAITTTSKYVALPRNWLFFVGIIAPALVHAVLVLWGTTEAWTGLGPLITAGLYVTNGLTAYDIVREGALKIFSAIAAVVVATLVILIPLRMWLENSGHFEEATQSSNFMYESLSPIEVVACILLAAAARLSLGLGSAGIIGAIFWLQLGSVESVVVVVLFSVAGTLIFRKLAPLLALTQRQQMYVVFIVGGIVSWFGLFWAAYTGIGGAAVPLQYALEPLIVIPLMVLESTRIGLPKALSGATFVVVAVAGIGLIPSLDASLQVPLYVGAAIAMSVMFVPGVRRLREGWDAARDAGVRFPVLKGI